MTFLLERISRDPKAVANIQTKVGNYDWLVGDQGNNQRYVLMTFVTLPALQNLVKFNTEALGLKSVLKPELIK